MIDLSGKKYGELIVIKEAERRGGRRYWLCKCSCGAQKTVYQGNLITGHTTSCGCKKGRVKYRCDLREKVFGLWTVLEEAQSKGKRRYWLCKCKCGTKNTVYQGNLISGASKSCGCSIGSKNRKDRITYHGLSHTKDYKRWHSIKDRCYNSAHPCYKNYGARGIYIADEWKDNPEAFIKYIRQLPNYNIKPTLDRIDNNGPYAPGNLRFATYKENNNNRRRAKTCLNNKT